jgi:two-component system, cell cycle sensor histidine kinase and response regulator CckA
MDDPSNRILDELPVGVWLGQAPDGQVAYANRAFREILGMAPVEQSRLGDIPRTYRVFDRAGRPFPVDQLPIARVMATGQRVTVEGMVIHRDDGARIPIRAFGEPLRDAAGTITHVIVIFADITREARVEEERNSIEARLKLAIDNAPIAVFAVDRAGIITLSEGAGLERLGLRSGELVGKPVFELYREHPTVPGFIRRGLAGESFYDSAEVGEGVYDFWLKPLRDENGEVTEVLGVMHDMSELRRLQAAAIQNDRVMAMGTLAASVAHEINNPLTYVLHQLDTLREGLDELGAALSGTPRLAEKAAALQEELTPAYQGVRRIGNIVRELRSFTRPDDGRLEPVDARTVVEGVLKLLRKDLEQRARLVVSLPERAPVLASETRLAQVLMNLLINAQQSLPGGQAQRHEVAIDLRLEGAKVVFEVSDTGPGIPAVDRERVFEAFVTRKPLGEGTGLGLFVCRNIVRGLGGEISVRDRPGGGAIFRVELPAASGSLARPRPAPVEVARPPAGGRILVIDDEPLVARALCGQLADAGYEAEPVTDAPSAATRLLSDAPFDLVYCDLMMKGMTGIDLYDLLAAKAPHRLPSFVFMTGGAFTDRAAAFVAAHAESFVEKPFQIIEETRRRLPR